MDGFSRDSECLRSNLLWYDRRRLLPGEQDPLDLTALVRSQRGCSQPESFSHARFSHISFSHIDAILIANVSIDEAAELTVNRFGDTSAQGDEPALRAATARLLVHRVERERTGGWPTSDVSTARLTLKNSSPCDVCYCIAILGRSVAIPG